MKNTHFLWLFVVILLAATTANLIALYIAAQQVQKQLDGASNNKAVGAVLSLFGSKSAS